MQIAIKVGIWVFKAIAYACLCSKVYYFRNVMRLKYFIDGFFVFKICLIKYIIIKFLTLDSVSFNNLCFFNAASGNPVFARRRVWPVFRRDVWSMSRCFEL